MITENGKESIIEVEGVTSKFIKRLTCKTPMSSVTGTLYDNGRIVWEFKVGEGAARCITFLKLTPLANLAMLQIISQFSSELEKFIPEEYKIQDPVKVVNAVLDELDEEKGSSKPTTIKLNKNNRRYDHLDLTKTIKKYYSNQLKTKIRNRGRKC